MNGKTNVSRTILAFVFAGLMFTSPVISLAAQRADGHQVFTTYRYVDPMTGLEAFRLLIPKQWKVEGRITWSANPALPAQSHFRVFDPGSAAQFELFPTQAYFWTDNRMFLQTNPPGSLRFGTFVAQPMDFVTAVNRIVLPNFRPAAGAVQPGRQVRVPELEQLARGNPIPGLKVNVEGAKIRFNYQESGNRFDEELYAVVSQYITPMQGYYINYWYLDYVFSFRAPTGRLDGYAKLFQTMLFSMTVNPQWFAKVVNTKEMLAQANIQQIQATGRIGRMIAQAGSDMRADQQAAWEQRQQVKDRIVNNFCDHIRGVQRYNDPFSGKQVELPSEYRYAWANNSGEYIVTDSPSYNPNVGSNINWEQIQPVR